MRSTTAEDPHQNLITHALEPVLILDCETQKFVNFNQRALDHFKLSAEQLRGKKFLDWSTQTSLNQDGRKLLEGYLQEALMGGNPIFEWKYLNHLGEQAYCELRLVRFPPYDKQLIRFGIKDLSETKKQQQELLANEERLKLALSASDAGCYDWLPQTNELIWDQRMHEIMELDPDSSIDRNEYFFGIVHPEDQERLVSGLALGLSSDSSETGYEDEYRIIIDDRIKYIKTKGFIRRDHEGNATRIIGTSQDVSETKIFNRKLQDTAWLLHETQRISRVGTWDWNMVSNEAYWSDELYRIYGRKKEEGLPPVDQFMDHIHPDDCQALGKAISDAKNGKANYSVNYRIFRYDNGEERYLSAEGEVSFSENGQPERLLGSVQDITEHKHLSDSLRKSEKLYKSIIQAVPDAFYLLKAVLNTNEEIEDFEILDINEPALKQLGMSRKQLIGEHICEIFPVNKENGFFDKYKQVAESGEMLSQEYMIPSEFHAPGWYHQEVFKVENGIAIINRDISDRKNQETKIRESEARYRAIAEHFPDGMISLYDHDLRYTVVNGKGLPKIGLKSEDLEGKRLRDVFPPEIYERDEPYLLAALRGETSEVLRSLGDEYFQVTTLPVLDKERNIICGMVLSQNITALKQAEIQATQTLERLNLAVDTANMGIWKYSFETGQFEWNQQLYAIYELSEEDIRKNPDVWWDVIHPEDLDFLKGQFQKIHHGEEISYIEFRLLTKSNKIKYIVTSSRPIIDKYGNSFEAIGVEIDVTKAKQNENALREREAFLSAIIENSLNGIVVANDKGEYLLANRAAADMFGFTVDQMLEISVADIPTPANIKTKDLYNKYVDLGHEIGEFTFLDQEGDKKTALYHATRVRKDFNLSILADITPQKEASRLLKESQEKFYKAFHMHPVAMQLLDLDKNLRVEMNDSFYRLSGYSKEELEGSKISDINLMLDNEARENGIKLLLKRKSLYNYNIDIKTKNGEIRNLIASATLLNISNSRLAIVSYMDITEKHLAEQRLKDAFNQITELKNQLQAENIYLREEINLQNNFEDMVFASEAFQQVLNQVEQVAPLNATVLITGETGTGKELIARAIHNLSPRSSRPMIKVNCGAIPKDLFESELFGYEKGAFTGATQSKPGRFELADKSTIFLDEIGEMPLDIQVKLLRILQEGEFERLGSTKTTKVDVRIIAATNRDLNTEIEKRNFRQDLFFRLNVFPLIIPPLRERPEDIPVLVEHFVNKYSQKHGKQVQFISTESLNYLRNYTWPGNIRELENTIERSIILSHNESLSLSATKAGSDSKQMHISSASLSLDEIQRQHIIKILKMCNWKVEGSEGAAKKLNIKPSTLRDRMKKLGIKRLS